MSLDPRNHNWEKELESGLPDSRVKPIERDINRVQHGRMLLDRIFCANCGEPGGAVWPDCPHVFYVCEPCALALGDPPGTAKLTPAQERAVRGG